MEAKELRIGNYVNKDGNIERVCQGVIAYMAVHEDNHNEERFKPIQLTEEWLLKFGFKHIIEHIYKLKNFTIHYFVNYPLIKINLENDEYKEVNVSIPIKIIYVHQLQNLYFALTGEELIINKNKIK